MGFEIYRFKGVIREDFRHMTTAYLMDSDLVISFCFFSLRCDKLTFDFTTFPSRGKNGFGDYILLRVLFKRFAVGYRERFAASYFGRFEIDYRVIEERFSRLTT